MGRTHMTTGFTAGAWLAVAGSVAGVPAPLLVLGVPLCGYAALLPDLDHPRSTATYSLGPLTLAVSYLLCLFVDHRGPTHRPRWAPAFGAAVALPSVWLPAPLGGWSAAWWFLVVTLGCVVHVWGDSRTLSGVPWGSDGGRLHTGRPFRTGSEYEVWRRRWVYQPAAVVALVVAALVVGATVQR